MLKKIKVNHLNSGYWVAPRTKNLLSKHNRDYVMKVSKSFEDMLKNEKLENKELAFSFNQDPNFVHFNKAQKIKKIDFQLNDANLKEIENNKFLHFEIIPNLVIVWDFKAVKNVFQGTIPFYSIAFYENLLKEAKPHNLVDGKAYFHWTKFWGFVQKKSL